MGEPRLRVLLIEDDEDDYILVRDLLSEASPSRFALDWVASYDSALEEMERNRHDVYLLDYRLGGRSGLDLLRESVTRGIVAPVIFLTGQGDYEVDIEAMKAGASDYLLKGQISAPLLERSIRYAIDRKKVEWELRRYQNDLEALVKERTVQLQLTNEQLRSEITERERTQQALQESQRALSTLLSNLPGMVYRCRNDEHWTMEFVSAGCRSLTGYEPHELVENNVLSYADLIVPEDRHMVQGEVQSALRAERPFLLIYRIRCASGELKWVWEHGRGVSTPEGELVALEGFITDITERKYAEDALKESENRYRTLVESSSDAILMINVDREIVSFNEAFLDLFGFMREEVEGQPASIFHPTEESYQSLGDLIFPTVNREGSFRTEWEMRRKDGTIFPVEETISSIRETDGSLMGYVAIIRDITERRSAEKELEDYRDHLEEMVMNRTRDLEFAQKALIQREKLKTLGAISAEVAHEIRNPLMSIGGFALRLKKKYPELSEADIIIKESRRLERILDRIKHYLRPVEMRPQECDVNAIIHESFEILTPELERDRAAWRLDLAEELSPAYVDPGILTQVIINMVKNLVRVTDRTEPLVINSYESGKNINIELRGFTRESRIKDPELLLLPFDGSDQNMAVPICFKTLRDMGGFLAFSQEEETVIFTISLLKAMDSERQMAAG
ncbi:MAG: PAS domain S-box protein [Acidobacteriota bacterium]